MGIAVIDGYSAERLVRKSEGFLFSRFKKKTLKQSPFTGIS